MHQQLAAENVGQGFQLQVALGLLGVFVSGFYFGVVGIPLAHVVLRIGQCLALDREIAHAGGGHLILPAVDAFGIFSAGEFYGARRAGKQHGVAAGAVFVLDHNGLAADHVGGAVQQHGRGDAAGQGAVDGFVLVVEGVDHHHLRSDGAGGLVHVVVERDVRVRVDDPRSEIFSAGVDYFGVGRGGDVFADGSDLAILNVNAAP